MSVRAGRISIVILVTAMTLLGGIVGLIVGAARQWGTPSASAYEVPLPHQGFPATRELPRCVSPWPMT
jgi:hypothetical protein